MQKFDRYFTYTALSDLPSIESTADDVIFQPYGYGVYDEALFRTLHNESDAIAVQSWEDGKGLSNTTESDHSSAPAVTIDTAVTVIESTNSKIYEAKAYDGNAGKISAPDSGADADWLNIDADSGEVSLKHTSDFEALHTPEHFLLNDPNLYSSLPAISQDNIYDINVIGSDGEISSIKAVEVTLTDANADINEVSSDVIEGDLVLNYQDYIGPTICPGIGFNDDGTTYTILPNNPPALEYNQIHTNDLLVDDNQQLDAWSGQAQGEVDHSGAELIVSDFVGENHNSRNFDLVARSESAPILLDIVDLTNHATSVVI